MESELTVREIMDREYVGVTQSDDLVETVELLLAEDKETAVVLRGSEHVGVVTERDVLAALANGPDPTTATVGEVMSDHVPTVTPETTISSAADQLSTQQSRRLVVTDGAEPKGIVTQEDLLAGRNYAIEQESDNAAVVHADGTATTATEDDFENQGICEVCGTLTRGLASFNGQLRCPDCREV
jgi:CBS domain-containing protein